VIAALVMGACKYAAPDNVTPTDGATDALPDAGPCTSVSTACVSDGRGGEVLQECAVQGDDPEITPCPWGCVDGKSQPHCGVLQPSGGAVLPEHLQPVENQTLLDVDLNVQNIRVDTVTGEIAFDATIVRGPGAGLVDGIEFIIRNGVGIFRFNSLTISEEINLRGANAVAFVALGAITVNEEIDLRDCGTVTRAQGGFVGGPGNQAGGAPAASNAGGAGGAGSNDNSSGGGGGAYAGTGGGGGGGGGGGAAGGTAFGEATIMILRGGGGGGGGGNNGGRGGNGGGAIQLAANGPIGFSDAGRINAGGCGGQSGEDQRAAGGGGAGGAILLEAPTITLAADAVVAVNGGGGGGGDRPSEGAQNGQDGLVSSTRATGGNPGNNGGRGGDGAGDSVLGGDGGSGSANMNGGGGGGGGGWIRINTLAGAATIDLAAVISPTSASQAAATVQ